MSCQVTQVSSCVYNTCVYTSFKIVKNLVQDAPPVTIQTPTVMTPETFPNCYYAPSIVWELPSLAACHNGEKPVTLTVPRHFIHGWITGWRGKGWSQNTDARHYTKPMSFKPHTTNLLRRKELHRYVATSEMSSSSMLQLSHIVHIQPP